MSKSLMISLISKASNGAEILSILDAIVAEQFSEQGYNEPTADVIDF
jgi:ribose 5-phosphate isomerase RpiB